MECIYVFREITGNIGDIISCLTDILGVYEAGVAYPLNDVQLEINKPYAVSNYLIAERATIKVREGILAVFHYK